MPTSFKDFNLKPEILRALADIGFETPTPIQEQAIPEVLKGHDIVATAQTGTGKTAAYLLPILQKLKPAQKSDCEALVLAPTRELALQIGKNLTEFSKYSGHQHTVAYGGSSVRDGRESLRQAGQIVIATPGRLLDYLQQGALSFKNLKIVILDEADRMLDMGFIPDIRRIMRRTPKSRQTMLFSATFPDPIAYLAREFLRNPKRIAIGAIAPAEGISQMVYPCDPHKKLELLAHILETHHWESALLFTRTKRHADAVARKLKKLNYSVGLIHGDRTQPQRLKALEGFKKGRFKILVATNIAARGLDISGITHVVNIDMPDVPDDYIHRIGRTARYDATGDALTIVSPEDYELLLGIEAVLGYKVPRKEIPEFAVDIESLYNQTMGPAFEKKPPVYFGYTPEAVPEGADRAEAGLTADESPETPSFGRAKAKSKRRKRL